MIVGIGTDIVQIKRIEQICEKNKCMFKNRILNNQEIEKFNSLPSHQHINFLAKRFAAKESISKAFGTGINKSLTFKDIIILNNEEGRPYVEINKNKIKNLKFNGNIQIDLSIADDYPIAIAFCVISTKL